MICAVIDGLVALELSSQRHRLKPFEVSPHDCKQSFAANLRTVIAYERLFSHPYLIVTNSSDPVGWIATVASKSALVAPILMATAKP